MNNQHFPTCHYQDDVAKCFLWLQLRWPAIKRSISSGKRSQPREHRRASESGKAFLLPFLALASFRVALARDFSIYTVTIYIHQLKTLFAGCNISCNTLAMSLLAKFSKK